MKKILFLVVLFWPIKVFSKNLISDILYQESMISYTYHFDFLNSYELFDSNNLDVIINNNDITIKGKSGLYFISFKRNDDVYSDFYYLRVVINPVKLHLNYDSKYNGLCLRLYENNIYIKDICLNSAEVEIDRGMYSLRLYNNSIYMNKEYLFEVKDDYYLDLSFEDKIYDIKTIIPNLDNISFVNVGSPYEYVNIVFKDTYKFEYVYLPKKLKWGINYV